MYINIKEEESGICLSLCVELVVVVYAVNSG
jgi:hypothetical protein